MTRRWDWFSLGVVALCLAYVALALTPSSYALVFRLVGAPDLGLWLFEPRPVRSDEWAVWTPFVQAAVNNGFERFNATSVYGEDLRNFNGLPLWDWALPFKPQFWLFFLLPPAFAFSFSHAVFIGLFLVGYHRLFRALGFPAAWSAPASLLLFFSGYAQLWWTTTGPVMAVFPWLLLVVLSRWPAWAKGLATAWLGTFWLLAHLYPPVMVPLAFVGVALLLAFRRDALDWRTLLSCGLGAAVSVGLAYLYLADAIAAMTGTVYPGKRVSSGGTVSLALWLSHVFPFLTTRFDLSLLEGVNVCEAAAAGSWLPLLALAFADHRALAARLAAPGPDGRRDRLALLLPLGAALALSAWMVLPVPSWLGRPLLWDRVPPPRMTFALGLALAAFALAVLRLAPPRLSKARFALAALLGLGAWWAADRVVAGGAGMATLSPAWALLPLLALLALATPLLGAPALAARGAPAAGLVAVAAVANAIGFGGFNPVQSAHPLFDRPTTPATAALAAKQQAHPQGWLVSATLPGAVLNGMGYRSVAHVVMAPALDFFRQRFPAMDPPAFDQVFNRYAHVQVADVAAPDSPQPDVVRVPRAAFGVPALRVPALALNPPLAGPLAAGGHVGPVVPGNPVVVHGWALMAGPAEGRRVSLRTAAPVERVEVVPVERPDVVSALGDPGLSDSGFTLKVFLARPEAGAAGLPDLCVVSADQTHGERLLHPPPGVPDPCADLRR